MNTIMFVPIAMTAASVSAQPHLILDVGEFSPGNWAITAELLNPTDTISAVVNEFHFIIGGTNISGFSSNPLFNVYIEDVTPTQIDYAGTNLVPPLNTPPQPDSSNPLMMGTFAADSVASIDVVGTLTGAYEDVPFANIFFYQNADGTPGSVTFEANITPIPTPGSLALLGLGGLVVVRRRR